MTRDQAIFAAQQIADTEACAVYLCTPNRGTGSYQTFFPVRASEAKQPWRRGDRVIAIVRPNHVLKAAE